MTSLQAVSPESFTEFFLALWGYSPFPWQEKFAKCVCEGTAPDYVTVPTGTGKTACIDAAVFALAVQASRPAEERTLGRRIFFIVNRRIIVDEAFERAKVLAQRLKESLQQGNKEPEILTRIAGWLKYLTGDEEGIPLDCTELRGGIYRDRAWAKSLIQPMILCSTVDQAGSRLLFRGYGVSAEARPIHAALVGQDSLLFIDEAHISQPFLQTLKWVEKFRRFGPLGCETVKLPFSVIKMTATPPKEEGNRFKLGLTAADHEHATLKLRLNLPKNARLVHAPKAKGKSWVTELAKVLEEQASTIIKADATHSIAIMVNRVATARAVAALMEKKYPNAKTTLVLGRMRPLDREEVTKELQRALKTGVPRDLSAPLRIIVSTQCLEVGADLDFAALVTECASLDALRQRFGRLNRAGDENLSPRAVIVLPEEMNSEKPPDPIYGSSIPRTWKWLSSLTMEGEVDFGLNAMTAAVDAIRSTDEAAFEALLMPRADAPVLLPAYLDCWAQTNPGPAADPDVAIFLHGPQKDMSDVQVCWRADLPDDPECQWWAETLALCPPTTLECLPVPIHVMKQWLIHGDMPSDMSGDAPASIASEDASRTPQAPKFRALLWQGVGKYKVIARPSEIRPGDTLVLRTQDGGLETLGHVPGAKFDKPEVIDCAEAGQLVLKHRVYVRLHPSIWPEKAGESPLGRLIKMASNLDFDWRTREAAEALAEASQSASPSLAMRLDHLSTNGKRLVAERYPDQSGIVLSVPNLLETTDCGTAHGNLDDGPDDPLLETTEKQRLDHHTLQVVGIASHYVKILGLNEYEEALSSAAALHDVGKADRRFQAMLIGGTLAAAYAQPFCWAKSTSIPSSALDRRQARERASLVPGFRHEMLSVQFANDPAAESLLPMSEERRELALHLIASHHGHARPFAPIVNDAEPPEVEVQIPMSDVTLKLSSEDRLQSPPHALDSGIVERFWALNRRHGWWGLALLEAVLRIADQTASANPIPSPSK